MTGPPDQQTNDDGAERPEEPAGEVDASLHAGYSDHGSCQ
jgi:hypothetical protein